MTERDLLAVGFMSVGSNCLVDSRALILGAELISLGSNVRVDAFSVLSSQGGRIEVSNNVHVATGVVVYGGGGVVLGAGSGLAAGVKLLSATDDYLGGNLTNPTMPDNLRAVSYAPVALRDHAVVGVNSVILPGSTIGFGAAVGALTLVKGVVQDHQVVAGNPMRVVWQRDKTNMLTKHEEYLRFFENNNG